jgi:hypothetical protein
MHACRLLVGEAEIRGPLGKTLDNMKIDLRKIRRCGMD